MIKAADPDFLWEKDTAKLVIRALRALERYYGGMENAAFLSLDRDMLPVKNDCPICELIENNCALCPWRVIYGDDCDNRFNNIHDRRKYPSQDWRKRRLKEIPQWIEYIQAHIEEE